MARAFGRRPTGIELTTQAYHSIFVEFAGKIKARQAWLTDGRESDVLAYVNTSNQLVSIKRHRRHLSLGRSKIFSFGARFFSTSATAGLMMRLGNSVYGD
jgi:hypothetical protein